MRYDIIAKNEFPKLGTASHFSIECDKNKNMTVDLLGSEMGLQEILGSLV